MPTFKAMFDKPEIKQLLNDLFDNIFEESFRGALLIGTTYTDEHLTGLLRASMPKDMSKEQIDTLFQYPGPLASFSAKIQLSYAFRLINRGLYQSLNALRKLRNDAAHSSKQMLPKEIGEKMREVYGYLGQGWRTFVFERAAEMLTDSKIRGLEAIFDNHEIAWEERQKHAKKIFGEKAIIEKLEKEQLPFWEMLVGLFFICCHIAYYKYKILSIPEKINIWSDFMRDAEG